MQDTIIVKKINLSQIPICSNKYVNKTRIAQRLNQRRKSCSISLQTNFNKKLNSEKRPQKTFSPEIQDVVDMFCKEPIFDYKVNENIQASNKEKPKKLERKENPINVELLNTDKFLLLT